MDARSQLLNLAAVSLIAISIVMVAIDVPELGLALAFPSVIMILYSQGRAIALIAPLRPVAFRRGNVNVWGVTLSFAALAVAVIVLGVLFGSINRIDQSLANANMTIPQDFKSTLDTTQSFAGITLLILSIALLVGALFAILLMIRGGGSV